jgi:glycolate oxidase
VNAQSVNAQYLNAIIREIASVVGRDHITTAEEDLLCYAYDATNRRYRPDAVVFPENTNEVSAIMRIAGSSRVPVVPRGAGTGMSGGALAVAGGLVMVMTRLNRILSIDEDNLIAVAEPGVITARFQEAVEERGLFYPPDPSSASSSTLGGNVAECAGGPRAVKYGVTRDYVLGLEVVLPAGDVIRTGVQTAKGVVGYDTTRLIVGSEGTLGIITKIILRLLALPEAVRTVRAVFPRIHDAAKAVVALVRSGVIPRSVEYMDQSAIRCVEAYVQMGLPVDAGAMLLIEVDGSVSVVAMSVEHVASVCRQHHASDVKAAESDHEAAGLWQARKAISPALFRLGPDKINEDIVVPRSRIPDMVEWIDGLRRRTGLQIVSFGHAGDGNIHFNIMLDRTDATTLKKAEAAVEEVFRQTLAFGGTISGEHGVGVTKAPYLSLELGTEEISLMKRIKKAFDPNGILNPGKIFPPGAPFI